MYTFGRKQGCRMSMDYSYKGMRIAYLENEIVRVGVLLDKGADIFEFTFKPIDLDFMWQSPIELRKPFVATSALPEGAFHDYFYGGWQEVLPQILNRPAPQNDPCQQCADWLFCGCCKPQIAMETGSESVPPQFLCELGRARRKQIESLQVGHADK